MREALRHRQERQRGGKDDKDEVVSGVKCRKGNYRQGEKKDPPFARNLEWRTATIRAVPAERAEARPSAIPRPPTASEKMAREMAAAVLPSTAAKDEASAAPNARPNASVAARLARSCRQLKWLGRESWVSIAESLERYRVRRSRAGLQQNPESPAEPFQPLHFAEG